MKKKTKLPFSMMPASWGLKGKSRLVAEAEYYYEGIDLEKRLAEIDDPDNADVVKFEIELREGVLTEQHFNKHKAELLDEPYVNVLKMDVDPENPKAGFMELDWNDKFVAMLHQNGYKGASDEDVVNQWFNDLCRTVLLQERADLDFGMQSNPDVDFVAEEDNTEQDDTENKE